MILEKPAEQLSREDIARQAFEAAALKLEAMNGNSLYKRAWRKAAYEIRLLAHNVNFNRV